MKKILFTAILVTAAVALSLPAESADLPLKATPAPFLYPAANGLYWGIGTIGGGGNANVSVPGFNTASLVTNQISINGIVGYAWNVPNSSMFSAVEGWFGFNNFNGNQAGFDWSGPATFTQRVLLGAPLDTVMALFPNFGITIPPFPPLPNGQTATNVKPYLFGSISEDDVSINFGAAANKDWRISPGFGVGALGQLSNGTAVDVFAMMKFPQKAFSVGPDVVATGGLGTQFLAGLALKW
jgi:hypothetical protein